MNYPAGRSALEQSLIGCDVSGGDSFLRRARVGLIALLSAILGVVWGFPHEFLVESGRYLPYLGILVLVCALIFMFPRVLRATTSNWSWLLAIIGFYTLGVVISTVAQYPSSSFKWQLFGMLVMPIVAMLIGRGMAFAGRYSFYWFLLAGSLVSLLIAFYITRNETKIEFYEAVEGTWTWTGNRAWVSPLTGMVVRATNLNSSLFLAGLSGFFLFTSLPVLLRALAAGTFFSFVGFAVFTETRGLIACIVIALGLRALRSSQAAKTKQMVLIILGSLALLGLVGFLARSSERFSLEYNLDAKLLGREELWMERFTMISEVPLGHSMDYVANSIPSCHNQYIEMFFIQGWFPGVAFLMFCALSALRAVHIIWEAPATSMHVAVSAAILAILIHGLFESHLFTWPPLFWSLFLFAGFNSVDPLYADSNRTAKR